MQFFTQRGGIEALEALLLLSDLSLWENSALKVEIFTNLLAFLFCLLHVNLAHPP